MKLQGWQEGTFEYAEIIGGDCERVLEDLDVGCHVWRASLAGKGS